MDRMKFLRRATEIGVSLSAISLLLLAGCGGGGGSSSSTATSTTTTTTTTVTGVGVCPSGAGAKVSVCGLAATGAAIGGIVYAYDVNGKASPIANINTDGTYVIDATGLTAPLMVTTIGVSNLKPAIYHSIAKSSDLNKNVNVTPLTEVILAHAAGQPAQDIALASMPAVTNNIPAAASAVKAIIAPLTTAVGATVTDPMTDTFKADGTGMDKVLDNINVMPAKQGGTIDVRLVGNNVSLGTVALPVTAGAAATATPNAGVTPTQLTNAQKIATAGAEIKACFNSLSALYATAMPTASQVQAFLDPNFKGWGMNATQFATYLTTAAPNGRGEIGLKFDTGSVADYDLTAPASGVAMTLPPPQPVTYDVNGNITAMWGWGSIGGMKAGMSKIVKNAAYTGCPGGWQMAGNSLPIGDVQITPHVSKQIATVGGTATFSRNVSIRVGQLDINKLLTGNPVTGASGVVIVSGPGFATYQGIGVAPTTATSITLQTSTNPTINFLPIVGFANPIANALPYCSDAGQTVGEPCFDDTKVAAGSLYKFSIRAQATPNTIVQEFALAYVRGEIPFTEIVAKEANIFPAITSVTPTAATIVATANAAGAGGANMSGIGGFSYTMPSTLVSGNTAQLWIMDNIGTPLDIFQSPTASGSGTWTVPAGSTKTTAYTNAVKVWRGIDADYVGYLVNTGVSY